jgi:hypothetical protein
MKYEDSVKLEELAAAVFEAKQLVEAHCARNTAGLTDDQKKQAFIELTMAEAKLAEAEAKLKGARAQIYTYGHLREA